MKLKALLVILLFIATSLFNCEKPITDPDSPIVDSLSLRSSLPRLTTTAVINITSTTATGGGNVTSSYRIVTARGIVWGTAINPTIALTTKTNNVGGLGTFTSSIINLVANTTYYVRAYATSSAGTGYGTQVTFKTTGITPPPVSGTFYVASAGSNSNNGSINSPFATLAYACSKVKTAGNIIHIKAGAINETTQSILASGVSIEGEGVSSIISSTVSGSYTINCAGNQHISNLKMDGNNLAAYGAIKVTSGSNVQIYNCTIINFSHFGVSFENGNDSTPPSAYATGNVFHNNIVTNCSGYYGGNLGCLEIDGQDGMLVYNNTMSADRGGSNSGDVIYGVEGWWKNVKIYNNTLIKTFYPGSSSWDFAIEVWNVAGGLEIYNNNITGSVDLVMCSKGSSAYSAYVHNNSIGQTALKASQSTHGILMEYQNSDIIVERNNIHYVAQGIMLQQGNGSKSVTNIKINYNIFYNIGANTSSTGWGIYFSPEDNDDIYTNIQIYNNDFYAANTTYSTIAGIYLVGMWNGENVSIKNNIIYGFDNSAIYGTGANGQRINTMTIDHNIFFGNGASNNVLFVSGLATTNYTSTPPIKLDPLFVSLITPDFHLQSSSPAINAGISVGISTDFAGTAVSNPPEIGAYEY